MTPTGHESSAYFAGRLYGQIFVMLLLLAGILQCIQISRRETTNTKCVLSLMFMLLLFFVAEAFAAIDHLVSVHEFHMILMPLLGMVGLGLMVLTIVFAILGLAEYSQRKGFYQQGRAQAIWALVLVGVVIGVFILGVLIAAMKRTGRFGGSETISQQIADIGSR